MAVISKEVAQKDVERWLDFKKIRASKREENKKQIDGLISAVSDGILVINDDNSIDHELLFPLESTEDKVVLKTLKYKPRIPVSLLNMNTQGIKADDFRGQISATIASLTVNSKAIINKIDTEDFEIGSAIAVFFM